MWVTCFQNTSLAQQTKSKLKPLKGMVMNVENDELLVGVHIYAKIAHIGRVSDQQGMFEMRINENDTLIVTFVGYERQVIPMAYFRENSIDLVIRMDSETIVLPGITIVGEPNIDYLKRPERTAISIPGLQAPAEKPDVDVPVGSLNYGPLSRWGKEAKEKRKLMEVYSKAQKERIYIQTVSSDSVRTIFMHLYDLNEKEYNDFVIFFNTYKPLMDKQDPKDIVRVMHQTFMRYKPGRE
ncbi:MAG: carboxypeptidase-like regulatory domain-containing protein [Cyclobacteriaceae bacterium]|nr:carboxypeptidase-like regulatory domain-containing protein [Cyclobacteriaceae bacterium]